MIKTAVDIESGKLLYLDTIERGEDVPPSEQALDNMADLITALQNAISDLYANTLKNTGNQELVGTFTISDPNTQGAMFQIDFVNGVPQLATNSDIDILPNCNFVTQPKTEEESPFDYITGQHFTTKNQVLEATSAGVDYLSFSEITSGETFVTPSKGVIIGKITEASDNIMYDVVVAGKNIINGTDNIVLPVKGGVSLDITFVGYEFTFYPEV